MGKWTDRKIERALADPDIVGVDNSSNTIFGDSAGTLTGKGKNQTVIGGDLTTSSYPPLVFTNILYGDAFEIDGQGKGGNDVIVGGDVAFYGSHALANVLFGDADWIHETASGGDDVIFGGDGERSNNLIYGDARLLDGKGGDDLIYAGTMSGPVGNWLTVYGDAETVNGVSGDDTILNRAPSVPPYVNVAIYGDGLTVNGLAGDDVIDLGFMSTTSQILLIGDAETLMSNGGDDVITGARFLSSFAQSTETIYGDAINFHGTRGGNDLIDGGDAAALDPFSGNKNWTVFGDASELGAGQAGGDDHIVMPRTSHGDGQAHFMIYADARILKGDARGGNDVVSDGEGSFHLGFTGTIYGDAEEMFDQSTGGDDVLTGHGGQGNRALFQNFIHGDAHVMHEGTRGGDDIVTGATIIQAGTLQANMLYGDAQFMYGAQGGDDIINAGQLAPNYFSVPPTYRGALFGDGELLHNSVGGNDRLVGQENWGDDLWGDGALSGSSIGGADRFVFNGDFGDDVIHDFRPGEGDRLEFAMSGVTSLADLGVSTSGGDTIITVFANTLTIKGYVGPIEDSFLIFA